MMAPGLRGIDHVHVYVGSREQAEKWYASVLGFRRVESLMAWAVDDGPLMLEDPGGRIHLALFESERGPDSTIAFGAGGEAFLQWRTHLEAHSVRLRIADHALAWSMYFHDPFGNYHEITTYDYDHVAEHLGEDGTSD
jgi:catechol-2,3-dioxygenase